MLMLIEWENRDVRTEKVKTMMSGLMENTFLINQL